MLEPQGPSEFSWDLLDRLLAAGIPTVVVTSRADEDLLDEAARRHAAAILTKLILSTEPAAAINRL